MKNPFRTVEEAGTIQLRRLEVQCPREAPHQPYSLRAIRHKQEKIVGK